MKKILSMALLLAAAAGFTSCVNEEDDLFSQSAAERLNAASALYSERLTASPNGWAVQLYPTKKNEAPYGNGYLLMFRFHKDKMVDASMNNSLSNNAYMTATSSWDVITDNGPVLTFNTYNKVVHTFSDPEDLPSTGDSKNPNDETGTGVGGDYEFIIVDAPEDASYMMLKGKKRGTYNLLTPVEEGIDFESYLADIKSFQAKMFPSAGVTTDYYHRGDSTFVFANGGTGIPTIYPYGGDEIMQSGFNPFLITKRGSDYYLRFRDSFTDDNNVTIQDFKYDTEKDVFMSVDDDRYYICGDTASNFFNKAMVQNNNRWNHRKSGGKSESFTTIYNALSSAMQSGPGNLSNIMLGVNDNKQLVLTLVYGKNSARAEYYFDYSINGDDLNMTYLSANTAATTFLERLPAVKAFIDFFAQDLTLKAGTTAFDLTSIKIMSKSDNNNWFIVSL